MKESSKIFVPEKQSSKLTACVLLIVGWLNRTIISWQQLSMQSRVECGQKQLYPHVVLASIERSGGLDHKHSMFKESLYTVGPIISPTSGFET